MQLGILGIIEAIGVISGVIQTGLQIKKQFFDQDNTKSYSKQKNSYSSNRIRTNTFQTNNSYTPLHSNYQNNNFGTRLTTLRSPSFSNYKISRYPNLNNSYTNQQNSYKKKHYGVKFRKASFNIRHKKKEVVFKVEKITSFLRWKSNKLTLQLCRSKWPYNPKYKYQYQLISYCNFDGLQKDHSYCNFQMRDGLIQEGNYKNKYYTLFLSQKGMKGKGWNIRDYANFQV